VEVHVERHPDDGLEIRVCDEGRGMMPRSDSPGLGVGLPLVAKLAQRFRVETRPTGGTAVSMVFPVRDPA
jgi:anti-sigma regulatory factor (Ser/Thr protein kinase)